MARSPIRPPEPAEGEAEALTAQALELFRQGRLPEGVPLLRRAADLQKEARGPDHPDYAAALDQLGTACLLLGDFDQAEAHLRRALEIRETTLGAVHPATIASRKGWAELLAARGDVVGSASLYRRVLAEQKAAGLHRNAEWADMALLQGRFCRATGDLSAAEALLRDALAVMRTTQGNEASGTLDALEQLADLLIAERRFSEAEALCAELEGARRATVGTRHVDFARAIEYRAEAASGQGDYARAETLWRQALEAYASASDVQDASTARVLNRLGALARSQGRLADAASFWHQALDAARRSTPSDPELLLGTLNNLALLMHDRGQLGEAEALLRQVLAQLVATRGTDDLAVAGAQNNLAGVLRASGRYAEAETLLSQALDVNRRRRGEQHAETAKCAANLGFLYYEMGLYAKCEPLYRTALAIRQAVLPANHPDLGESLQNLGELFRVTGRPDAAEALLEQALDVWRRSVGAGTPNFALTVNNLALLAVGRGDWARAEQLYREAIASKRALFGAEHPDLATSLDTLAELYRITGRHDAAEPLCREALDMRRRLLGDSHPDVAWSLNNLAVLRAATNREEEALDLLMQSSAIDDQLIGQVFAMSSEAERLAFLGHLRSRFAVLMSLLVRHVADRRLAVRRALELVLRRKGIAAEALAAQRDAILGGRYPELRTALDELARLRERIGRKTLSGPDEGESVAQHEAALAAWRAERAALEARLARAVPEIGLAQRLRTIDAVAVARALPQESALIEFVHVEIHDFLAVASRGEPAWLPARYVALVVPAGDPEAAALIDLGEADPLDRLVRDLRAAITQDASGEAEAATVDERGAGRELRQRLLDPLLPVLGERKRLLVSPDGALAGLPLEVLPLEDDSRVIDRYVLSYVSTGRDLLRFEVPSAGHAEAPLVAADPDFDLAASQEVSAPTPASRQSRDVAKGHAVPRLLGTRIEGRLVGGLLGVEPLMGREVLKARFRTLRSPALLHVATHGFFLADQRGLRPAPEANALRVENPLLRSGLLLAGFNAWLAGAAAGPDAEDGILNAEDVSGLDLVATEMAVLSACETGLGEVHVGEGVFGLRRAFELAGARTIVMSLWKVPDQQTLKLMGGFYRSILAGLPRAEALREAQLAVKALHPEPVYWAAFICQGDPRPLRWSPPGDAAGGPTPDAAG